MIKKIEHWCKLELNLFFFFFSIYLFFPKESQINVMGRIRPLRVPLGGKGWNLIQISYFQGSLGRFHKAFPVLSHGALRGYIRGWRMKDILRGEKTKKKKKKRTSIFWRRGLSKYEKNSRGVLEYIRDSFFFFQIERLITAKNRNS